MKSEIIRILQVQFGELSFILGAPADCI